MPANDVENRIAHPAGAPSMRFRWVDLLFAHWPVDAGALRPLVPAPFEIDEHEGTAWVGLVPFLMRDVRHRWAPPVPTVHHFPECNVRTYVRLDGVPGVWFFTLDATSRLAVWGARTLWRLNYKHAWIEQTRRDDIIDYAVRRRDEPRASLRCRWRVGAPREPSPPGNLAHFLTERYALFTIDRRGRPRCGRIWHRPWPLHDAELLDLEDGLVASAGIEVPSSAPVVYHADEVAAKAWGLKTPKRRNAESPKGALAGDHDARRDR